MIITFQTDSVRVTEERNRTAKLFLEVISMNLYRDVFVNFTTSSGTATGEIRGCGRSSNWNWSYSV